MSITLPAVVEKYLLSKKLSSGTCKEYRATATKWLSWGKGVTLDRIERTHIREFLDWVHEQAKENGGTNAGRTANKSRENLRAILSWAWDQDLVRPSTKVSKPEATAGCCRPPLSDQGGSQRLVFRHLPDEATAWLEAASHRRALLACRVGCLLQLRRRYRNALQKHCLS